MKKVILKLDRYIKFILTAIALLLLAMLIKPIFIFIARKVTVRRTSPTRPTYLEEDIVNKWLREQK